MKAIPIKSILIVIGLLFLIWLPLLVGWYNWKTAMAITLGSFIGGGISSWYFGLNK